LSWLKIPLCNFFPLKYCGLLRCFSILFFYFFKIIFVNFFYWADWEFSFVNFFFKTLLIATVFFCMVFFLFFMIFFEIIFFILFFNVELVKNYSYNMRGKHCNFLRKLLSIATVFFLIWFFFVLLCFSLKLSMSILFFKY